MKKLIICLSLLLLFVPPALASYTSVYTPTGAYDVYVGATSVHIYEKTYPGQGKLEDFLDNSDMIGIFNRFDKEKEVLTALKPKMIEGLNTYTHEDITINNDFMQYIHIYQSKVNPNLFLALGDVYYNYKGVDINPQAVFYIEYTNGRYTFTDCQIAGKNV